MNQKAGSPSRLSYSYTRPDLAAHNPLIWKASRITPVFDRERDFGRAAQYADLKRTETERRQAREKKTAQDQSTGSQMVKRQQPKPILKPSPSMAKTSDAAAFNTEWAQEHRRARRQNRLAQGRAMVKELENHSQYLEREQKNLGQINSNPEKAKREAFKIQRRTQQESARVFQKSHSVKHSMNDH